MISQLHASGPTSYINNSSIQHNKSSKTKISSTEFEEQIK